MSPSVRPSIRPSARQAETIWRAAILVFMNLFHHYLIVVWGGPSLKSHMECLCHVNLLCLCLATSSDQKFTHINPTDCISTIHDYRGPPSPPQNKDRYPQKNFVLSPSKWPTQILFVHYMNRQTTPSSQTECRLLIKNCLRQKKMPPDLAIYQYLCVEISDKQGREKT